MLVDGDEPAARFDQVTTGRAAIFAETLSNAGWLTVLDGPLHGIRHRCGLAIIGYVKTHHRRMLAREHWVRVPELTAGERSGLFAMADALYGCYLRVGDPGPWAGPWARATRAWRCARCGRRCSNATAKDGRHDQRAAGRTPAPGRDTTAPSAGRAVAGGRRTGAALESAPPLEPAATTDLVGSGENGTAACRNRIALPPPLRQRGIACGEVMVGEGRPWQHTDSRTLR